LTGRYISWLNDPETVKYSEQRHKTHTLESCKEYIASHEGFLWAIEVDKVHIGNVSADYDPFNDIADIGILLGEMRGQGYGGEAFKEALWTLRDVRRLTMGTMGCNHPMVRIGKKYMKLEGQRRGHFLFEGKPVDMLMFGL